MIDDFPYLPPSSHRAVRDRIEAALMDLTWDQQYMLCADNDHKRRVAAGALRKAFMPELARMRATEETLARVRKLARQFPEDGAVPVRRLLAALYGDEKP
jgi:N-acyl-D-aspartate/D-glutamate deacylase